MVRLLYLSRYSLRLYIISCVIQEADRDTTKDLGNSRLRIGILIIIFIRLINMAGLPPLSGFYIKTLIALNILQEFNIYPILSLITGSGVFALIYLRICFFKIGHSEVSQILIFETKISKTLPILAIRIVSIGFLIILYVSLYDGV